MDRKVFIRGAIYAAIAFIVFAQDALRDMPELSEVTAKSWVLFGLGAVAQMLVPLRAFIDQTVARQENNNKQ